ncbi:MAG: flagellar motor protein MotB, partial [Pedobacter sp.]
MLISTEGSKPDAILNYARALQNNSKYSEAKEQYIKYAESNPAVSTVQKNLWLQSCDSAVKWMQNPKNVTINNEKGLNSLQSDWGAVKYLNGIVYTSDRTNKISETAAAASRPFLKFDGATKVPDTRTYGWTGNDYLRLYERQERDSLKLFPLNPGTKYHIGNASFSNDAKKVFFSITQIPAQIIRKKGEPATINIELYSSEMDSNGNWGEAKSFRYNNANAYSVGDPYLSNDGNTLYFVSNMPGGSGGTDIYKCERNPDGTWGDAQNQSQLNTPGNERSPAQNAMGEFSFSSDGFPGMGGLDIFTLESNGKVTNLGYPLNSPQDDFAFYKSSKTDGFLSSNRPGGLGSDDIYSFIEAKMLAFMLTGKVYDK